MILLNLGFKRFKCNFSQCRLVSSQPFSISSCGSLFGSSWLWSRWALMTFYPMWGCVCGSPVVIFLKRAIHGLFCLYFRLFNTVDKVYMNKISPMTGFELRTSAVDSDRSTNWATTATLPCGKSYKRSTIVIYVSRIMNRSNLLVCMTLEL